MGIKGVIHKVIDGVPTEMTWFGDGVKRWMDKGYIGFRVKAIDPFVTIVHFSIHEPIGRPNLYVGYDFKIDLAYVDLIKAPC